MKLSIVTTMYHSESYLEEFYARTCKAAEKITDDYEIIFVNDGSPDDSLDLAVSFYEKDKKVRVVDLSRNFGHHKAMMTGLAHAVGDLIFLIDCDLEEAPELMGLFDKELQASEVDVVYGVQERRKGDGLARFSGGIFYKLFNFFSTHKIPENLTTVRLMTRRYVDNLLLHEESEILIAGLWVITGFEQKPVNIIKHDKGSSTYSLTRRFGLLVNSITSFSNKPLIYIFYTGFIVMFFSSCYIVYLVIKQFFFSIAIQGYTSLIVSIWFLSGVIIFCLGVLGIYLAKVFTEIKNRPNTIIRHIYKKK